MSKTPTIALRSDRQTVRSTVAALLSGTGIALTAMGHDAPIGEHALIIYDASQQPFVTAFDGVSALAARDLSVLIIANNWSTLERARLRTLGKIDIAPEGIGRDELLLRITALQFRTRKHSVLIIEDDDRIAREIGLILADSGYETSRAADLASARGAVQTAAYDLLIVDRNLPGGEDGLDFVRFIRAQSISTPALMVTARIETSSRVEGLRAGANDYMCKPFDQDELLARIDLLLQPAQTSKLLRYGALEVHLTDRLVRWAHERIALTDTEFDLLAYFAQRPGLTLPMAMILTDVWNTIDRSSESNVVATAVRRLRKKLEAGGVPHLLLTDGEGYRFDHSRLLAGDSA